MHELCTIGSGVMNLLLGLVGKTSRAMSLPWCFSTSHPSLEIVFQKLSMSSAWSTSLISASSSVKTSVGKRSKWQLTGLLGTLAVQQSAFVKQRRKMVDNWFHERLANFLDVAGAWWEKLKSYTMHLCVHRHRAALYWWSARGGETFPRLVCKSPVVD